MNPTIRLIYLYLFSFIGLLITILGCVRLVDLGLKMTIFKDADRSTYYPQRAYTKDEVQPIEDEKAIQEQMDTERKRQHQRDASGAIAMILVGTPVYIYHWKIIQKTNKK